MTQDLAIIRSRAANGHRANDARQVADAVASFVRRARAAIDEAAPTWTMRAAHNLALDLRSAMDEPHEALDAIEMELSVTIRMIERNPAATLAERPLSRRILRAMLDLAGTPSTIEQIARQANTSVKATAGIMRAIHGHRHAILDDSGGERRYSLTTKGTHPSLSTPDPKS